MDLTYSTIEGKSKGYRRLVVILVVFVAVMFTSFMVSYLRGQQVWGIGNAVPWGQLITLDIYFIGLSAGAIVVSGLCYVLRREEYKPIGRVAVFLGLLLFIGAMVCVLVDLGRPEKFWRLFMYGYLNNMTSMFALNSIWYGGYALLMIVYLWLALENKIKLAMIVGTIDVIWAMCVHSFTGAIFGLIGSREILFSPIKPFEFITAALTSGTALLILAVLITFKLSKRYIDKKLILSLGRLLSIIIVVLFIMVFFDKLTHMYFPAREGTVFLFTGPYWWLFWIFQIGMGLIIPLIILFHPKAGKSIKGVVIASISVVIGVLGERAALVIPGTAQVQQLYPGTIEGIWGAFGVFRITFWETTLTLGIVSLVVLLFVLGLKYLELLPVKGRIEVAVEIPGEENSGAPEPTEGSAATGAE
ncbi:MAG: NrfD/PsrC family molybdoenzyme membrane anchor subunit [Dehalococcoidales bacterium]|jgi:molybdopterin-containing oxidoreductase family membrane subunit